MCVPALSFWGLLDLSSPVCSFLSVDSFGGYAVRRHPLRQWQLQLLSLNSSLQGEHDRLSLAQASTATQLWPWPTLRHRVGAQTWLLGSLHGEGAVLRERGHPGWEDTPKSVNGGSEKEQSQKWSS